MQCLDRRFVWTLLLVGGLVLVGCGDSTSSGTPADTPSNPDPNPDPNPSQVPNPDPTPNPDQNPAPTPDPTPDPNPGPNPDPNPDMTPDPNPDQVPCGNGACDVGEMDACPGDCGLPETLQFHWANLQENDRVTFGKQIIIEFDDPGIEIPDEWEAQQYWSRRFPATMYRVGPEGDRTEVPLRQRWLKNDPKYRFRPAMLIEPRVRPLGVGSPRGWPKAAPLNLVVGLGGEQTIDITFRTLPVQYDQFRELTTTVPVRDCPTCFPYPVDAFVYVPPGYLDTENPENSNPAIHLPNSDYGDAVGGSDTQRYPVVVLMHTAGEYQNNRSLANAAGLRMAWGLMEPTIFVLPNARLSDADCNAEPQLRGQRCHTRFVGLWRADETIFSYRDFLVDDFKPHLAANYRIRGSNSDGQITDAEMFRRSFSLYGLSAGGYGVLVNAFGRPDGYYATVSIVPGIPSSYNPWALHGSARPSNMVCPGPDNHEYPLVKYGFGYRDMSGVDPETDRRRSVHFSDRSVPAGSRNCYQALPEVQHELVRGGMCLLDIACLVDPEAPDYASTSRTMQPGGDFPYHGNIYFDTAIFDRGGPPAAFIDLDEVLDRADIPHTFRYEDRGALFHDWRAVSDRGLGFEYIDNGRGLPRLRGNFPGPGSVYPFLSRAMEGVGNPEFNSYLSSEFTSSALDFDRDGIIHFVDDERPDISDPRDNCPQTYNPDQIDKDNDGLGDVCDDDIDGDGIPNADDDCNWPQLPIDPADPEAGTFGACQNDVDGDGVDDLTDLCPEVFDPLQLDTDRDNRGDDCENDDDNDGIIDSEDNCRLDVNEDQADLDGNGHGDICDPSCILRPRIDGDGDGVACLEDCNDADPALTDNCE